MDMEQNDILETDATWSISLDCECPYCEHDIDLIKNYSEDIGEPLNQDENLDLEVCCPKCRKDFIVKSLNY